MATDLITKLEEAGEGSRVLDGRVEVFIRDVFASRSGLKPEHSAKWRSNAAGFVSDGHTTYASNPVTTSLDAALALASRVLPGWVWNMGNDLPCWVHLWIDDRNYDGNPIQGNASTPALALCAAILRASEQERGG